MRKLAAIAGVVDGTVFALVEDSITVGRADECLICLEDDQVSRQHALLIADGDEYRVRDLNSANGTYVNGQRVTEARLAPGDIVQMGAVRLVYERQRVKPAAAARRPVEPAPAPAPRAQPPPVVAVGSSVATLGSLPQPEVAAPAAGKRDRNARLILWVGVGSAYFILMGWLVHRWLTTRRSPSPAAPVTQPGQPRSYTDPQGRFVCAVPDGWRVEETPAVNRSKVVFVAGTEEIRVLAQPGPPTALTDADQTAVRQAFQNMFDQVRDSGVSGRLLETRWREVEGVRAVEVELELETPRYCWMRQVKFRQDGNEHTVALYVGARERRADGEPVWERFLAGYRPVSPAAARLTARQP